MERLALHPAPASARQLLLVAVAAVMFLAAFSLAAIASPKRWKAQGWTKTDFSKTSIKWDDILSGGPPKDGIPSIDKPKFIAIGDDKELKPKDPVIGLEINGDARAYPLRVLIWHEIVNDTVGGVPVSITYCPLCNSAIVFDRRVGNKTLDFGTTGKLRNSDLVMYDRQSESWWQQFTGEAIVGSMLGTRLKMIPARLESFAQFKARNTNGKLLVPNNPEMRRYGQNPYVGYDRAGYPFLYKGEMPKGIEPMVRVIVVKIAASGKRAARPLAVTMNLLRKKGTYRLGDVDLSWKAGQASALDSGLIARGRDVGTVLASRKAADGTSVPVPYDVTFAFVYHAFHPDGKIIK